MKDSNANLNSRRSIITGLGVAIAGTAAVAPMAVNAQGRNTNFKPARHNADAWMDDLPGNHRIFIDSSTGLGGAESLLYAANLNNATNTAYEGEPASLAMIICLRHFSTPFAFNNDMWEKYSEVFYSATKIAHPDSEGAPFFNLMRASNFGFSLPNFGNTIDSVREMGVEIAICDAATQFLATQIVPVTSQSVNTVYEELKVNAVPGHFVSAGVMALTRAQEYGYSLLYAG
jgi:hypothetical protein